MHKRLSQLLVVILFTIFCPGVHASEQSSEAQAPTSVPDQSDLYKSSSRSYFESYLELKLEVFAEKLSSIRNEVSELSAKYYEKDRNTSELQSITRALGIRIEDNNNRVSDVNTWLAMFGIMLTVILAIAGTITYLRVRDKSVEEARNVAKTWISTNEQELREEIERLKQEALSIKELMQHEALKVAEKGEQTRSELEKLLTSPIDKTNNASQTEKDALKFADEKLSEKLEKEYTPEDWLTRAFASFGRNKFDEALVYLSKVIENKSSTEEQIVSALFNKATILTRLSRYLESASIYEELYRQFKSSSNKFIKELVIRSCINRSVNYAQLERFTDAISLNDQTLQEIKKTSDPNSHLHIAMILSNNGNHYSRIEQYNEAISTYDEVIYRFGNSEDNELRDQVGKAFLGQGWCSYLQGNFNNFLALTEKGLKISQEQPHGLANKAFALVLLNYPDREIEMAYDAAAKSIETIDEWESIVIHDLKMHNKIHNTAQHISDDFIHKIFLVWVSTHDER